MSGEKTLIYNGQIITVNEADDIKEAVVIEENKILFVGSNKEALEFAGTNAKKIDAEGCSVVPGFIDAHIHMAGMGIPLDTTVNASAENGIKSIEDIKSEVKRIAAGRKPGEWIMGSGYNQEELAEMRNPTRWDLDQVAPKNPVIISHISGHMAVCNTMALELAHVLDGKVEYPTEHVLMDGEQPSGILKETAYFMSMKHADAEFPDSVIIDGLANMNKAFAEKGITSVHDAGCWGSTVFRTMQQAAKGGKLTYRNYPMIWSMYGKEHQIKLAKTMIESGFYTGFGDDMLRMGPIKLMLDGSSAAPTCATREPFSHNGQSCPLSISVEEIEDVVVSAHKAGFQITVHAIGDKAIETILTAYEKAQALYPRNDPRHRIEHCTITQPDLAERIKGLGVIPVANPGFIYSWGSLYNKFYGEREKYVYPVKSFKNRGVTVAFGSDAPAFSDIDPLVGIAAAMERKDMNSGDVVAPRECVGVLDALRMYTYNCAYSSFEEKIKGSIEVDKLADIVILDKPILEASPNEIRDTNVKITIFDGKVIYRK